MQITTADTLKSMPGPEGLLQIMGGFRRLGFLGYIGELWRAYGDTFRLNFGARSMTIAIHPESVRQVSITNRENYEKLQSYDLVRRYMLGNGLLTSNGELWKRQRKLMAPFYTPRGVQAYGEMMLRDGQKLVERWERIAQGGQPVEISDDMTTITASIILRAMFSMEADEDIVDMKETVETMIGYLTANQSLPFRIPDWLPTRTNRRYHSARAKVHAYINGIIAERRALPQDEWPDDLLARLMLARDEETGEPVSNELLRDESITTFFAGHETTAKTLTALWYCLSTNPEAAAKLHDELDSVLGGRVPTMEDLHHLPYALQVIKETLRLYPPAPVYVRDAIADDVLDGFPIPAGSSVLLSPFYTHRHPDFWPDPLRFDPDRWTPEAEAERHPQAYHPFASGQRVCIGNNFSLLETHILLALLGQKFAPRLLPGHQPKVEMRGTLSFTNGMPMYIEKRA